MALGVFKQFYRDINNGNIYQYIADACRVETRELVAICAALDRAPNGRPQLSQIVGLAFKNFFVVASREEVDARLRKISLATAQAQGRNINNPNQQGIVL